MFSDLIKDQFHHKRKKFEVMGGGENPNLQTMVFYYSGILSSFSSLKRNSGKALCVQRYNYKEKVESSQETSLVEIDICCTLANDYIVHWYVLFPKASRSHWENELQLFTNYILNFLPEVQEDACYSDSQTRKWCLSVSVSVSPYVFLSPHPPI